MRQGRAELEYKFKLKENYGLVISTAKKENESMKIKPAGIAGIIFLTAPFVSEILNNYQREALLALIILSLVTYFYLKISYKHKIALNEELIPIWHQEAVLQEKYSDYLYKLEEDHLIKTGEKFTP